MTNTENLGIECGCSPFPAPTEGGMCAQCQPNNALTCEEESILAKMRDIKHEVRGITERLNAIQAYEAATLRGVVASKDQSEWNSLFGRLEDLRTQWKDWQLRLEDAIERKLIFLGHREPK